MELPFRPYFSSKTVIIRGLAIVAGLYVLLAIFIAFAGPSTLRKAEDTLASQKISIDGVRNDETKGSHHAEHSEKHESEDDEHAGNDNMGAQDMHPKNALLAAPIDGLSEPSKDGHGVLPITNARGLTPFHAYKRSFNKTDKPVIALAIRDFGMSRSDSINMLRKLPRDVTLIVSPYATHISKWAKDARAAGHETWLYIPTQNADYPTKDPGPLALLKSTGLQQTLETLEHSLAQFSGYSGVAMDMDKTFLTSQTIIQSVLGGAFKRGLGYFEMNSNAPDFFQKLSQEHNAPYVQNDMGGIENMFENIEARAQTKGYTVAAVSLNEIKMDDLISWIHGLEGKGFALAPLSAVADGRVGQ